MPAKSKSQDVALGDGLWHSVMACSAGSWLAAFGHRPRRCSLDHAQAKLRCGSWRAAERGVLGDYPYASPPRHRPHYAPAERLAILELRAARAWMGLPPKRGGGARPPVLARAPRRRAPAKAVLAPLRCAPRGWGAFAWWLLVVVDHYSRVLVHTAVFPTPPSACQVCAELTRAVRRCPATGPPKYMITDQGRQFQSEYRAWCRQHRVRPRYGAVILPHDTQKLEYSPIQLARPQSPGVLIDGSFASSATCAYPIPVVTVVPYTVAPTRRPARSHACSHRRSQSRMGT